MKKLIKQKIAGTLLLCMLCSSMSVLAKTNTEKELNYHKTITIDIINTKNDFEFEDEEETQPATPSDATPSDATPSDAKEKPINIQPKDPVPEPPKDDIVNYPADIQTPPTPSPEHIEKQKIGTIDAYYEHARPSSRTKYYIDDNGFLHILWTYVNTLDTKS